MCRSMRIFMLLLLVSMWTASLFSVPNPVRAQAEQPATTFQEHIVQPGEHIFSIAERYQTTAHAIVGENQLPMPVYLVPGQRLRVPSSQPPAPAPSVVEPNTPEAYPQPEPQWQGELTGEKWIDVNLSEQTLTAYQGDTAVRSFQISSGDADHQTVTGSFHIWAKVAFQNMSGVSRATGIPYYQEDVPWVQYFYADYSIHGAYWHDNFGSPTGHGCINMRVEEARWVFEWAEPSMDATMVANGSWLFPSVGGTRVEVHH